MITDYKNRETTANKYAKQLIVDRLRTLYEFSQEELDSDLLLTYKERQAIEEQLYKRIKGTMKYLGY